MSQHTPATTDTSAAEEGAMSLPVAHPTCSTTDRQANSSVNMDHNNEVAQEPQIPASRTQNVVINISEATEEIPPPKPDYSAPPPYEVVTKLPSYEEVQREKTLQGEPIPTTILPQVHILRYNNSCTRPNAAAYSLSRPEHRPATADVFPRQSRRIARQSHRRNFPDCRQCVAESFPWHWLNSNRRLFSAATRLPPHCPRSEPSAAGCYPTRPERRPASVDFFLRALKRHTLIDTYIYMHSSISDLKTCMIVRRVSRRIRIDSTYVFYVLSYNKHKEERE
ncbi:unnamed protein product [Trichogramma brassicae]|uniref:Uncharacterized protein n=1 Tax=Trichogramma brassicae TaxID=86971 RepID=A0A6H5I6N3_9HYME|nr:unnamed protein product [Trichogramma brassicae]